MFKALLDDLNTPEALAHLHVRIKLNKSSDAEKARAKAELQLGASLLGLLRTIQKLVSG